MDIERIVEMGLPRFCAECGQELPVRGEACASCGTMPKYNRQYVKARLLSVDQRSRRELS